MYLPLLLAILTSHKHPKKPFKFYLEQNFYHLLVYLKNNGSSLQSVGVSLYNNQEINLDSIKLRYGYDNDISFYHPNESNSNITNMRVSEDSNPLKITASKSEIQKISDMNVKNYPSLTQKIVFKFMDLIDELE